MPLFHDVLFPLDISLRSMGGPERKTEIISFSSGREQRNARWQLSRRRYDAGYGVKNITELQKIVEFFEERRGRLYSFRWRDRLDYKSCSISETPSAQDQSIGIGNGIITDFQLSKLYGRNFTPYKRPIFAPVKGTILVEIDQVLLKETIDYTVNYASGLISFLKAPSLNANISAGFLFDVPVRFDTDYLEINLSGMNAGLIPNIPIIEVID